MRYKMSLIIITLILIFGIAGCATTQKKAAVNKQIQQFEARMGELESELLQKDRELYNLREELKRTQQKKAVETKPAKKEVSVDAPTPKNIQLALKNADLYHGPIDGKIGKNTKKAIVEFQKLNNLTQDGIIGKRTWAKLREFLY